MQNVTAITLFGQKSKELEVAGMRILCRYLNLRYLLNRAGIIEGQNFAIAGPARAVADVLHISPHYYFDNQLSDTVKQGQQLYERIYTDKDNYANA